MSTCYSQKKVVHYFKVILYSFSLFFGLINPSWSLGGNFFLIEQDCHVYLPYVVTLCLNGKGILSCQDYTVDSTRLFLRTTLPKYKYAYAGIKVNSPLYRPKNCSLDANQYCIFAVDHDVPTLITVDPVLLGFNKMTVC